MAQEVQQALSRERQNSDAVEATRSKLQSEINALQSKLLENAAKAQEALAEEQRRSRAAQESSAKATSLTDSLQRQTGDAALHPSCSHSTVEANMTLPQHMQCSTADQQKSELEEARRLERKAVEELQTERQRLTSELRRENERASTVQHQRETYWVNASMPGSLRTQQFHMIRDHAVRATTQHPSDNISGSSQIYSGFKFVGRLMHTVMSQKNIALLGRPYATGCAIIALRSP